MSPFGPPPAEPITPRPQATFRGRLTKALALSTGAFLSIFCVVIYLWCRGAFLRDLDADLEAILRAEFAASDRLESHLHIAQAGHRDPDGIEVFGIILDRDGRVLKRTEWTDSATPEIPPDLLRAIVTEGKAFSNLQVGEESFRVMGSLIRLEGRELVEVLGISESPAEESLRQLRNGLAISLILGIALFSAISNLVARYLTRPLETILSQIESVTSSGDPGLRLTDNHRDQEILSLRSQINAMLEKLDRSFQQQRRFVSNASHELRAPLSNLTLAIEVCLRRERAVDDYREVLQTCQGETLRLNEMVHRLLILSQGDEGALALSREAHDLSTLLTRCRERHRLRAAERDIELRLLAAPVLAWVDESGMAQVLDNVLDNSLRYAPAGSSIELGCSANAENAEIRITDHGPGLSTEQCRQLFERFYRADASRQRGTGGAGLGLAIARAFVEAHGGTIGVESEPNVATTFIVSIPLGEPGPPRALTPPAGNPLRVPS